MKNTIFENKILDSKVSSNVCYISIGCMQWAQKVLIALRESVMRRTAINAILEVWTYNLAHCLVMTAAVWFSELLNFFFHTVIDLFKFVMLTAIMVMTAAVWLSELLHFFHTVIYSFNFVSCWWSTLTYAAVESTN